jgi:hypothetical protein
MSIYIINNTISSSPAIGAATSSTLTQIYPRYVNNNAYCRINEDINSATTGPGVTESFHLYVATRNSSTQDEGYKTYTGVTFHNAPDQRQTDAFVVQFRVGRHDLAQTLA